MKNLIPVSTKVFVKPTKLEIVLGALVVLYVKFFQLAMDFATYFSTEASLTLMVVIVV